MKDPCADCGKRCAVGVSFVVELPGGRTVRWRLCPRCFEVARRAERDS